MKRHSHPTSKPEDLTGRLREQALKVTGPRRAILNVFHAQEHPVSIAQLRELMRDEMCDLATVYRVVKKLERLGMVKRFDFGDGVARYELKRDPGASHHHHLICTDCAKIVEIEDCFPEDLEQRIAQGSGFTRLSHKLEFFGICPSCQMQ